MKIDEMTIAEIEERLSEISAEVETRSGEELDALKNEVVELQTRKAELVEIETRKADAEALEKNKAEADIIIEKREEMKPMEEKKVYGVETKEYRDAFYSMLAGNETVEQRAIVVDGSAGAGQGDAIAIPKTLDEKIWDGIHTAHPILADISTVASGIAMEVTKHTAIAVRTTKKGDNAQTPAEESNTFVKVTLYGYDYEKYVELSYAEAKMSAGALEDYLAQEISAELGEALAKDVFAQIEADATSSQEVTKTADMFKDIKDALALATSGGAKVIYAPATEYYEIVGAVKSGSPFNIGATLGCAVKLDNGATHVTILDPKAFVLNEVQGVMIESQRDVKAHKVVVSGYMRAQGCLRMNNSASYIA